LNPPRDLQGLVLDLDGLLIDSEMWSWQAHNEALAQFSQPPLTLEEIRLIVGLDAADEWTALRSLRTLPGDDGSYSLAHREAFIALRERSLAPLPGVHELLTQADAMGLRLGLASNSPLPSVTAALTGIGILRYFTAIASGHELPHGKPHPGVYLLALERLGLRPEQACAIEDSAVGMTAARAAGLYCIVVPSEITAGQDFTGANLRVESLTDVARWLEHPAVE
jgi:HAD superfamily hydrolase (TIGR01509 family)